ncbi:EVE domain-containing protein [Okibacterium endophyticum]
MAIRYWLAVVHRDHVRVGVAEGFAQVGHGRREGLGRMRESDGLVFYSPRESADGPQLKCFTAIGRIADDELTQVHADRLDATWRPWRRRVDYRLDVGEAPIRPLIGALDFTRDKLNWGYQLRSGLIELSRNDFDVIGNAMRPPSPDDRLR